MGERKSLPRLALIADGFTQAARADATVAAVPGGVNWVHLRDHTASDDVFASAARRLVERLRAALPGIRISVNTRIEVAQRLRLDVHVGVRGPSLAEARARMPDAVAGYSAHTIAEAQRAESDGATYVFFSPIFPTSSKPGHVGVGLGALQAVCEVVDVPVYALGGLTPATIPACLDAGAYGIAALSGILSKADPAKSARAYASVIP